MPKHLNVIDLFSGVGGLSLGATKASFNVAAAVEWEERALNSHARNFPNSVHLHNDVSKIDAKTLLELANVKSDQLAGVIGGPPCQGFSNMGKGDVKDSRNQLFYDFFRLVNQSEPAFFLAENVPGILNSKYDHIRERAKLMVEAKFDMLEPILINASEYGAATTRTRVFFVGVRKDVHGIEGIHNKIINSKSKRFHYVDSALDGLPVKISDDWGKFEDSWRPVANVKNSYLKSLNEIIDNIGDEKAMLRFQRNQEVSGSFGTKHSSEVTIRYGNLNHGQQDPISKSTKLKPHGFCPTLRAGTDSTKGSFQAVRPIHPSEPRVITPREAARLQGFPDWFQFHETKWHSFRQIGNSVCPIAAEKMLSAIRESLRM